MKNKKIFIIPLIITLIILNSYGYLSFEEKGMCVIQSPMNSFSNGKTNSGGFSVSTSTITESQCTQSCQIPSYNAEISTCQFKGNYGTNWVKTSEDFPPRDVFGVK